MQGERMRLEQRTVQGEEEDNRWGPRGINTPRSRIVTVIFQSSEPPRKNSELPTFEISADCSPYGRNLREKTQNLRITNSRGKTAAGLFPLGED
jgi:hypothetical protein